MVKELQDYNYSSSYSAAYAINGDASPKVAGAVQNSYNNGYQTWSGLEGGWWTSPNWLSWSKMRSPTGVSSDAYPGQTPEPFGVADTTGGQTWYAGSRWDGSKRVPWRGLQNSITYLGTLKTGGAGEALAIANNAADVRRIVGWTDSLYSGTTYRRPAMWRGTQNGAEDLGSLTDEGNGSIEGAALAVNSFGNIGGWSKKQFLSPTTLTTRGFLLDNNDVKINAILDMRYPLGIQGVQDNRDKHSVVYGIEGTANACGVSHDKSIELPDPTNAVVWRGSSTAVLLGKPHEPAGSLVHSDALLLTQPQYSGGAMRPVGRVWTNNIVNAVAVFWNLDGTPPALLTDQHFTQGTANWVLKRPRSSNASGCIVGEGTLNGVNRGFVMIRRN